MFTLSNSWMRWLYNAGSLIVFGFTGWYFLYRQPALDYNELLSVLIGAQVTVVTVMFSAVLVALQLGSAQFSPRITRAFFRYNPVSQSAFYAFLLGISICFAVKLTYNRENGTFAYDWMPPAAAGYCFLLLSVVLPRFVFHISDSINVASIIDQVTKRTLAEIQITYGEARWQNGDDLLFERQRPERPCIPVRATKTGFLDHIHWNTFLRATRHYPDWTFFVAPVVGNFISPGEVLVQAQPPAGEHPHSIPESLDRALKSGFVISYFRSYEQDIAFGIRQLVDIAIKAISPAVNDPTTAVNCLHYLAIIVTRFGQVTFPAQAVRAMPGNIHVNELSFESVVNLAFDQIFQWGKGDPVIVCKILEVLTDIITQTDNPHGLAILSKQARDFGIDTLHFSNVEEINRVQKHWQRLKTALNERNV